MSLPGFRPLHHQPQSLGDHLRSLNFVIPRERIGFLEQSTFDAHGYHLGPLSKNRTAATRFLANPCPLLALGRGQRFARKDDADVFTLKRGNLRGLLGVG